MSLSIPSGNTADPTSDPNGIQEQAPGTNAQAPPTYPTYEVEILGKVGPKTKYRFLSETGPSPEQVSFTSENDWRAQYGSKVWPETSSPQQEAEQNPTQQTNNDQPAPPAISGSGDVPLDPRLIYVVDDKDGSVVYSFASALNLQAALIDGFVVRKPDGTQLTASSPEVTNADSEKYTEFFGVPAIMNYNAYVNLQGAGGKFGNKYLVDRENQPRWYDVTAQGNTSSPDGSATSSMGELTVKSLVSWSEQPENGKFPYRYQDFVFLKWWKKIPLNYMITLRRYTMPVIDSVGSAEEAAGKVDKSVLTPAATAITFLGEDAGNKISSILGPIEAALKWKEVKADVWEVSFNGSPATAQSPVPGLAKVFGFLQSGPEGAKAQHGGPPPDPYNNGPYSNKILGPINVIDSTRARDRGLSFKHEFSLVFEYSARSIGGINTKAAMLDILGNLMLLTYNEAPFWGGMNRYMPQGAGGNLDPFLGGPAGRAAWLQGNPEGFFKAVSDQFTSALKNVGDAFSKFLDDPVSGLKSLASGAASSYMKMNTSGGKGFMQGIHSLLTGNPVGEWHVTVGNPMNPMMMVGNLICTGITIEFNDELGPDDFPTELKATVKLEHGMPRDRAGIESMFNKGRGRIYSLPKGYDEQFASTNQSAIDTSLGGDMGTTPWGDKSAVEKASNGRRKNNQAGQGSKNPLLGDPGVIDGIFGYFKSSTVPKVRSVKNAIYSHGVKYTPSGDKTESPKT
jgi:hypothetical protein